MLIYVAGPYYPYDKKQGTQAFGNALSANVDKANRAGQAILGKGHVPFIPHTMMRNWEDEGRIDRTKLDTVCGQYVRIADALLFIGSSKGADRERKLARELNIPIYTSVDDIPVSSLGFNTSASRLIENFEPHLINVLIAEYNQCAESYRHTYETIWIAGGFFTAISAALLAFWGENASEIPVAQWALVPIPILIWWHMIFRPMDGYGDTRSERCKEIEEDINKMANNKINMRHFIKFEERKNKGWWNDLLWSPRVSKIMNFVVAPLLGLAVVVPIVMWSFS